jgi:hypothetical protein
LPVSWSRRTRWALILNSDTREQKVGRLSSSFPAVEMADFDDRNIAPLFHDRLPVAARCVAAPILHPAGLNLQSLHVTRTFRLSEFRLRRIPGSMMQQDLQRQFPPEAYRLIKEGCPWAACRKVCLRISECALIRGRNFRTVSR